MTLSPGLSSWLPQEFCASLSPLFLVDNLPGQWEASLKIISMEITDELYSKHEVSTARSLKSTVIMESRNSPHNTSLIDNCIGSKGNMWWVLNFRVHLDPIQN